MFENKLTLKQADQIFGALQVPIAIIGYFNFKSKIRLMYLILMIILSFSLFILSFSENVVKAETVKKAEMNSTQKWEQILGIVLICIGLLPSNVFGSNIIYSISFLNLSFIDLGIFSLIMPPIHTKKKE